MCLTDAVNQQHARRRAELVLIVSVRLAGRILLVSAMKVSVTRHTVCTVLPALASCFVHHYIIDPVFSVSVLI